MKLDLDVVIRHLNGGELTVADGHGGAKAATLSAVLVEALLLFDPTLHEPGEDKLSAYHLATRAHAGGGQEFTVEELAFMKRKVLWAFGPAVVGPVVALLDQRPLGPST